MPQARRRPVRASVARRHHGEAPDHDTDPVLLAHHAAVQPGRSTPAQLLALQSAAGNSATTVAIQRDLFSRFRKKKPEPKTFEKTTASEMTSAEGANELMRVKGEVQKYLQQRDELVSKGTDPGTAARLVFSKAPPEVRRYLPLHSEFDVVKREVDTARNEEGGEREGRLAERMDKRSRELGYRQGVGDPSELKPKDVAKELEKEGAFRRQMERRAERLLLGDQEAAAVELETAQESGDKEAIERAKAKVESLKRPEAVQNKLLELVLDAKVAIDDKTEKMMEETKETLGLERISEAEKWRLREEAKRKVKKDLKGGIDSNLKDAGGIVGTIGSIGSKVVKGGTKVAKPLTKNLSAGQKSIFKGVMGSVGQGLKTIGGAFSQAVKLASRVADRNADKLDKDANVQIALDSLKLVKTAATTARGVLKVILKFNESLSHDPGFAAAIPGVALAAGVIGFVGNVVAVVPPTERLADTTSAERAATQAGNHPLATALVRTLLENGLQISTEVVGASANGVRIGASIAEIATAGGMGIPAAVRLGATAMEGAKKAADFLTLEAMRSKTQTARKEGVLQIEGSGKKLIKTDISYAVDTIILAAKKALAREAKGETLTAQEKGVLAVLDSYGIRRGEAGRLSMGEIHERMLDKLDQDDEQETVGMKLKAGVQSAKETLASLGGGDKEKAYVDLDTYARQQEAETEAKANQTTGGKIKAKLSKAGGLVKKIVTAPTKITKLGEMASEKTEKLRRLREIKNLVNYKERRDRGRGFVVSQFGVDLQDSIEKLRRFIVATQPPDKASVYLKELNTLSEQTKITKKVGERNAEKERASEKISDRVITPELFAKGESMSFSEVEERLRLPGLGKADREYLKYLLGRKAV